MMTTARAAGDEASILKMRVMELEMGIEGPSQIQVLSTVEGL